MSLTFTVRAAPFKLCAARNVVSRTATRACASVVRSNSSSPLSMASICSCASALNVASRRRSRLSSGAGTGRALHLVLYDQLLEPQAQLVQVARGDLGLPGAGHVLRARQLAVLHRERHLIRAHELLLAGGGN